MVTFLSNRDFTLLAYADCRICVWNASDGSLVHSLMGHSESVSDQVVDRFVFCLAKYYVSEC